MSLLGGSAKTRSWLRLRLRGIAFGGFLSLLGLLARVLHLPAFLLCVPLTRVLTIAHIRVQVVLPWPPKSIEDNYFDPQAQRLTNKTCFASLHPRVAATLYLR